MRVLRNVLRVYSYIFETILCAMGVLLSGFGLVSRNLDVHVNWLPWNGPNDLTILLCVSLLGLACVALAIFGMARVLLFLFSGAVLYFLVRGLFINTQYAFTGMDDAHNALLLVGGAALALVGALPMAPKRERGLR